MFSIVCSEKLRFTRNAVSDADVASEVKLGKEGEPFKFTQCVNKVTVEEAAVITNQITVIEEFIRNHTGRWKIVLNGEAQDLAKMQDLDPFYSGRMV